MVILYLTLERGYASTHFFLCVGGDLSYVLVEEGDELHIDILFPSLL